ncbi:MAG: acyltransferase family protein [Clostridia bacterium]|nr:acyltransferase family protein [Clostridia bacterium]
MLKNNRNIKIDILKSIAIFFVIVSHIRFSSDIKVFMLFPFWIDMAVPIFMILTAVNYTNSCLRKNIYNLKDCYSFKSVSKQLLRILPLYIILVLFEVLMSNQGILHTIKLMLTNSSFSPGAYYPIVFLQIIFILPIIYILIMKYREKALLLLSAVQLFTETVWRLWEYFSYTDINAYYRLLCFRYIIFLAVGCYYVLYREKIKNKHLLLSSLLGIIYIILFCMIDVKTLLFNTWTTTSMPTVLYIAPIVFLILESNFEIKSNCLKKILTIIGSSTYHIFILQSAWFFFFYNCEKKQIKSVVIFSFISIITCVVLGILIFGAENKIRQNKKTKKR